MQEHTEEELRLLAGMLPNIATQLRGSMANLAAAMEVLVPPESREQNDETDHYAAVFYQSYYRLCRLIGNLSEAGRLAERPKLALYDDDIIWLCRDVCSQCNYLFVERGLKLDLTADCDSCIIAMDLVALRRLLMNLLSNALKFTPRGGMVKLRVQTSGGFIRIAVSDTGIGMSEEKLANLFDHYREQDRCDPPPHGLGLGLALCRAIAQGHGGMLLAESHEGEGSTFTLALPLRRAGAVRLNNSVPDYTGGYNPTLLELSDALGADAFSQKFLD